jgi:O-antigen ligase
MAFCIFFAVAATASGARGGLVAMGLATLFIWISVARESSRSVRRRRRTTLIAIVIAVVVLLAPAMGLSGGIDRLIRYDEVTVGGSEFTSGRSTAIASAYDLILSSPVIGHGTPLLNKDTQEKLAAVPHNGLLQVGLRGGIVAMLIALAVIGLALLQASRFVFHHPAASGIVAVLFVRVFISSSGPLDSVTLALLFMLAWAEIRSVNSELRSNAASE